MMTSMPMDGRFTAGGHLILVWCCWAGCISGVCFQLRSDREHLYQHQLCPEKLLFGQDGRSE